MDFWKLMAILHAKQTILNPMREEKIHHLCELLELPENSSVIDIGCGKGEFLHRIFEMYGISGVGVDKSPQFIEDCKRYKLERAPDADIEYLLMDGKDYKPNKLFDVSCCIGASWIWGGIRGSLQALRDMTKPGGLILLGEPYWLKEPADEYLELEEMKREDFHTHRENVLMGDEYGITCVYTIASDLMDWDRYEAPHWWAVSEYVDNHQDDPDLPEIIENMKKYRDIYLRYGRDTMGWCIYVYRKSYHPIL
jgi:SAM-dependent methyltransferase